MWFVIFFLCIFAAIVSGDLREEIGIVPWIQWIVVGGLVLYMVFSWIL